MNEANQTHTTRVVITTMALTIGLPAAGCRSKFDVPIERYQVRMEADARSPEACQEPISIRFEPVKIAPQVEGNLYQVDTFTDKSVATDKPVQDGPDNWECWFTYTSPALAPGKWLVVGEFTNGSRSCLRDVGPGFPNKVRIDQEDACVEYDAKAAT